MAGRMSESHRESQLDGLSIMGEETSKALLSNDYRKIEKDVIHASLSLSSLEHSSRPSYNSLRHSEARLPRQEVSPHAPISQAIFPLRLSG